MALEPGVDAELPDQARAVGIGESPDRADDFVPEPGHEHQVVGDFGAQ
ncbi:hypothetical protein GA0115255_120043 [Streptomyces sp. Ncost-T6T-2b]|nr:hypothetical protein GA0115255_120043 [Streptomyces sp. Ncost-T6T-2b]